MVRRTEKRQAASRFPRTHARRHTYDVLARPNEAAAVQVLGQPVAPDDPVRGDSSARGAALSSRKEGGGEGRGEVSARDSERVSRARERVADLAEVVKGGRGVAAPDLTGPATPPLSLARSLSLARVLDSPFSLWRRRVSSRRRSCCRAAFSCCPRSCSWPRSSFSLCCCCFSSSARSLSRFSFQ